MTEELLFNMYKDTNLVGVQYFKKEIRKYKIANPYALYVRIINYQVKKYGQALAINCDKGNKEWAMRKANNACKRRYDKRRNRDISEQIYKRKEGK